MTDMGKRAWSDAKKSGPMLSRMPLGKFIGSYFSGVYYILGGRKYGIKRM